MSSTVTLDKDGIPLLAPPDRNPRKPSFEMPEGATNSHAHICGPAERYPFYERRIYTPPDSPLPEYHKLLSGLGVSRGVLVQPSFYGADNSAVLDALETSDVPLRGVVVVPEDIDQASLSEMNEKGIRGARLNIVDTRDAKGVMPVERIRRLAEAVAPYGWHIEFLAHVNEFPDLDELLGDLPVDVVFGHFGYMPAELGTAPDGFQALLRLMQAGKAWVKFTAPYRISKRADFADVTPIARAIVEAAPDRIVWGSDWPHVKVDWAIPMPNDGDQTDLLADWIPEADIRSRVLVDNPAKLYGF